VLTRTCHPVLRHGWDDIISPLLKNADFMHLLHIGKFYSKSAAKVLIFADTGKFLD
jgi:hypothetical protein